MDKLLHFIVGTGLMFLGYYGLSTGYPLFCLGCVVLAFFVLPSHR